MNDQRTTGGNQDEMSRHMLDPQDLVSHFLIFSILCPSLSFVLLCGMFPKVPLSTLLVFFIVPIIFLMSRSSVLSSECSF